jgi:tight adherence protein C
MLWTAAAVILAIYFISRGSGHRGGDGAASRLRRLDGLPESDAPPRERRSARLTAALLEAPYRIAPAPLRRLLETGLSDLEPLSGLTLRRMAGIRAWASAGLPAAVVIAFTVSPLALASAFPLSAAGFMLPELLASRRRKAYIDSVRAGLPYAADLLFAYVLGGKNLDQAFRGAAVLCPGPLGGLLAQAVRQFDLGATRDEAFTDLRERCPLPELSSFLGSLLESERRGHELSETLSIFSREMRLRRRDEVRATVAKAPLKMLAPLVFLILPASVLLTVGPTFLVTLRNVF